MIVFTFRYAIKINDASTFPQKRFHYNKKRFTVSLVVKVRIFLHSVMADSTPDGSFTYQDLYPPHSHQIHDVQRNGLQTLSLYPVSF